MIVNKSLQRSLFQKCLKTVNTIQSVKFHLRKRIGSRDWVAFGRTGCANYNDDPSYPFPAVRFKENTNELFALKEKEKGDWRKLSIEEKKTLYRASFRQTFAEVMAPTGEWKSVLGISLILIALGIWSFVAVKIYALAPPPKTLSDEYRAASLRREIDVKMYPVKGVCAKWDYEKDDWK